jgi:SHS family sialic acid transporter-like MFS transporter
MTLGTSLAVLSFGLTAVVIVLLAVNAPRLAQKVLRPDALWESDAHDRIPQRVSA